MEKADEPLFDSDDAAFPNWTVEWARLVPILRALLAARSERG